MAATEGVITTDDLADGLVDDLDGSAEDVATVWIKLRSQLYEFNLNAEHRQHLLAVLGPFLDRARLIADTTGEKDPPAVEALPPRRRRRPSRGKAFRSTSRQGRRKIAAARTGPTAALAREKNSQKHPEEHPEEEHPDYPWFPLHRVEQTLAAKVRAWASGQGIVMPDRGTPRSVLRAYYRRDLRSTTSPGGHSSA